MAYSETLKRKDIINQINKQTSFPTFRERHRKITEKSEQLAKKELTTRDENLAMQLAIKKLKNNFSTADQTKVDNLKNKKLFTTLTEFKNGEPTSQQLQTRINKINDSLQDRKATNEKREKISKETEKKVEQVTNSWYGWIKEKASNLGSGIMNAITYIPRKITEFVSTRRGKKILFKATLVTGALAVVGIGIWLLTAGMPAGMSGLYATTKKTLAAAAKKMGLDWTFDPGYLDSF